jgi:hypothetical protein
MHIFRITLDNIQMLQMSGKFTLEQDMKPRAGVEVWLYSFFKLGARWEWVLNATPRPLYPRE